MIPSPFTISSSISLLQQDTFSPANLSNQTAVDDALIKLERCVSETTVWSIVQELLLQPHVIELLLSGNSHYLYPSQIDLNPLTLT